MTKLKKGSKKLLNAWAFFDWANSPYTLTIASAVFPIFYGELFIETNTIEVFGFTLKNTVLISFVTAFAFLVIVISSPILSGIADYIKNKRLFLKFFSYMGSIGCFGLYWFSLDLIYWSLFTYFLGLWGYWGSLVFYNSYLPDIAYKEQQDAISAKGFSVGYFGSVLLLLINLAMVMYPDTFGIEGEQPAIQAMRYSFLSVGIWWLVFSQYTFYHLPKHNNRTKDIAFKKVLSNGFKELSLVWKQLSQNKRLKRYLVAFFVYSMAVQTIMLMATYFGEQEILWHSKDEKTLGLIISILIIQLVAILGAFLTSKASAQFGNIKTLIGINSIWVCICIYAYFMIEPIHFYVAAFVVGLVMGGIQALSRSTYSKFLPKTEDSTSFFSFYDITEKIGIILGMLIYGIVDQYKGMRMSILFLFVFFVIGIVLLLRVPKQEHLIKDI
ncbi:MFS transporter [Ichthyenterobacterium sp. W332]|uniref:MFS transporter n=1 Tax=Microcosmobacter mediterraneus TaxID=3075607 RepID=A0ABU2YKH0_9FLAO|nr:MFS transporter [Ichthyenterobacterium sp. W332]MDT0558667.1 MFS transporter [Ichthyenterobacterium sp. W332]